MALPLPILPQLVDNKITVDRIALDSGIVVWVPGGAFTAVGDELTLRLNGNLKDTITVFNPNVAYVPSLLIVYPVIPEPMILDYYVKDPNGNQTYSPRTEFIIVSGSVVNDYVLTAQVSGNNAAANGNAAILITYRLTRFEVAVSGQVLQFSTSSPGLLLGALSGQTDANGQYYLSVRSTLSGPASVLANLAINPAVFANSPINFTAVENYPITYGPYTLTSLQVTAVEIYLGPFTLIQGHVYELSISRQPTEWENCGSPNYVMVYSSPQPPQGSTCQPGTNNLEFLNTARDLSRFRALKSGPGDSFLSRRYGRYSGNAIGVPFEVKLVDHGPNASFVGMTEDYQPDSSDETFAPTSGN